MPASLSLQEQDKCDVSVSSILAVTAAILITSPMHPAYLPPVTRTWSFSWKSGLVVTVVAVVVEVVFNRCNNQSLQNSKTSSSPSAQSSGSPPDDTAAVVSLDQYCTYQPL